MDQMFCFFSVLTNIEGLKHLDVNETNNFSYMFFECSSLSDLKQIQNWNASKGKLKNIKP